MLLPVDLPASSGLVQRIDPLVYSGWDDLLVSHPAATFFHTSAWAKVIRETYRFSPRFFVVLQSNRLIAALPMMEVSSPFTGRRGVSLPFSDFSEPLDNNELIRDAVIPSVMAEGKNRDWKYFECRGGKRSFGVAPPFLSFFSHELKLCQEENELLNRFRSSTRGAIRKGGKTGLRLEISEGLDALEHFYSLHCKTRKKHGVPPQPLNFFRNIHKHILAQKKGIVVLARQGERVIAGAIFFHYGRQAIYKFAASDQAFQGLCGSTMVLWEAIKWYAQRGIEVLDFGRTSLANQGLRKFKLSWGSEERIIDYVRFDFREHRYVVGRDEVAGWANKALALMPVFSLRLIGRALYRHIA